MRSTRLKIRIVVFQPAWKSRPKMQLGLGRHPNSFFSHRCSWFGRGLGHSAIPSGRGSIWRNARSSLGSFRRQPWRFSINLKQQHETHPTLPRTFFLTMLLLAVATAATRLLGADATKASPTARPVTVVSYYFGNYHPGDPRNVKTKGADWSEWEPVRNVKPRFPGHRSRPGVSRRGQSSFYQDWSLSFLLIVRAR